MTEIVPTGLVRKLRCNNYVCDPENRKARQHLERLPESRESLLLALAHVDYFGIAVDGGAFLGTTTRVLASLFNMTYAFEPSGELWPWLQENTRNLPNCFLHASALADHVGECGSTRQGFGITCEAGTGTPTLTIDDLALPHCAFMKLDLEGYELKALMGAEQTITAFKPVLLLETKPFENVDRQALHKWLNDHGYREAWYRKPDSLFLHTSRGLG